MSPLLLHLTHHKCGTRWVESVCREVCLVTGRCWASAGSHEVLGDLAKDRPGRDPERLLSLPNANIRSVQSLTDYRAFHAYRDPRDILVSSYFSSLTTHSDRNWPQLTEHRARLQQVDEETGLLMEMDFISDVFESLGEWDLDDPDILEVSMESLTSDNYRGFCHVFSHLGLLDEGDQSTSSFQIRTLNLMRLAVNRLHYRTRGASLLRLRRPMIPVLDLLAIVHRNRFEARSGGRVRGEEDRGSHYRRGVAGDWVNHFTPGVAARFAERHGSLVAKLGYGPGT